MRRSSLLLRAAALAVCGALASGCLSGPGNAPSGADASTGTFTDGANGPSLEGSGRPVETGTDSDGSDGALPACSWPASFNQTGILSNGQCIAARAFLLCGLVVPGGSFSVCLSSDAIQCTAGGMVSSLCQNLCTPAEYGLVCVGSAPLSGCEDMRVGLGVSPLGTINLCCPCGAGGSVSDGGAASGVNDGGLEAADGVGPGPPDSDASQPTPDGAR